MNSLTMLEHEDGVVEVTLNRPEIHNAFDDQLIAEITTTFQALAKDDAVRVVILSSEGRSFSAGADLNWMRRMADFSEEENFEDSLKLAECMYSIYQMPCPVIAKVQGAAFGGGVGLVACCDIAIASKHASFCLSEVKLGLIPAVISPYVIQAMGRRQAQRYFVSAEKFNANQAKRMGLVTDVLEAELLNDHVMALAKQIASNGPEAVIAAKRLINTVANQAINQTLNTQTARTIAQIRASEQGKEGVSAFLGKRTPDWLEDE
ncbi:MAG: enoyl-CoA hydratase/isomerase family protein [Gammaproteobacteria bacterium]|nr:enoyl-CoA hydratase/isomerase family protein [Gammaproteobacteria bacterium]NNJ73292.1 enoyl-CoA hydratase/isomerase family protein [Enterobacterales bacterium]